MGGDHRVDSSGCVASLTMELTPDLLLEAKFSSAKRGYNMAEVDDFLERCAEGLDILLARLTAEFERAERAEAALADRPTAAVPVAEARQGDTTQEPEAEPDPVVKFEPEPPPAPVAPAPDVDEPLRVLVMAERTAEAAVREAKEDAERIRGEAESVASRHRIEAERLLTTARADAEAEAKRASETARREIDAELNALRRDRDGLNSDARNLQRWLDEQRGRMRTTVREMNRLIEDPTALRELPIPDGSEPSTDPSQAQGVDPNAGEPTRAVPAVDIDPFVHDEGATGPDEVNF